jgi:hypothetical protein
MGVIKCFNRACRYYDDDKPDNCSHPRVKILKCKDSNVSKGVKKNYGNPYMSELMSNECWCGGPKKPRKSFCYGCYKRLRGDLQRDLYSRLGNGYEAAYEAAVKYLEELDGQSA